MLSCFILGCSSGRMASHMLLLGEIATDISKRLKLRLKVNGEVRDAASRGCRSSAARRHAQQGFGPLVMPVVPFTLLVVVKEGN